MDWEKGLNQSRVNSSAPASDSASSFSSSCCNSSHLHFHNSLFPVPAFSGFDLLFNLKLLFIPLYSAVVLIACSGNLLLLFLIWYKKKRHNTTNFLISNLALVDLVMCIFCVPLTASYAFDRRGWVFGYHMCHFVTVMQSTAVYAAVLSLMAIAVDRYIVVAYPIRKRAGCQFCWGLVTLIWLSSLALSTPTALHTVYLDLHTAGLEMAVCEEFWDGQEQGRLIYSCFILFFSYFVPLGAVSISYCAISYQLKQRTTSGLTACPQLRCSRAAWSRRRRKTFCLLLVSVLCFAFSWLPLQVVNLIHDLDTDFTILGKTYINVIQVSAHLLAMSSACYNPFIYASLHNKFLSYLCLNPRTRGRGKEKHGGQGSSILTTSQRMPRLNTFTTVADLPAVVLNDLVPK
ncbi:prolactin releasing hormone 2 receptor [Girardinichthys multiradiatus]|uniref:prolactin releasing hormone 2 receptor n=1 Tax=Girardinichthys multiradiatus TaxID=208333 RepID=UPI001FAC6876|nr:prolactin releasing hormone 2 receptor [Girardinichthys multiradiatus]XP_047201749.1 prolactin releasing hormone 2 receptor [Girardinichthys multiradiatus]